jgi:hypothetical protein
MWGSATAARGEELVDTRRSDRAAAISAPGHAALARSHGAFNVVGGLWPLLSMPSFEAVTGPKTDRWLVRTVALLMVANGVVQWRAAGSGQLAAAAREIGIGTAATLGAIDLAYGLRRRISRMYLVDAVLEVGWVLAWLRSGRPPF